MTISERINLHRCGYSKSEIDALAAAEKEELAAEQAAAAEPAAPAEQEPAPAADQAPATPADRSGDILAAINNLTLAIQARNVNTQQQPAAVQQTMDDLIKQI